MIKDKLVSDKDSVNKSGLNTIRSIQPTQCLINTDGKKLYLLSCINHKSGERK